MRLIDADKITSGEIAKYLGRGYECCTPDIEDMLKEQPTAYDVDKVVDMLEDFKDMELIDGTPAHGINEYQRICKCIEIVKSGAKQCGVYTKLRSARKGNCI